MKVERGKRVWRPSGISTTNRTGFATKLVGRTVAPGLKKKAKRKVVAVKPKQRGKKLVEDVKTKIKKKRRRRVSVVDMHSSSQEKPLSHSYVMKDKSGELTEGAFVVIVPYSDDEFEHGRKGD